MSELSRKELYAQAIEEQIAMSTRIALLEAALTAADLLRNHVHKGVYVIWSANRPSTKAALRAYNVARKLTREG